MGEDTLRRLRREPPRRDSEGLENELGREPVMMMGNQHSECFECGLLSPRSEMRESVCCLSQPVGYCLSSIFRNPKQRKR